MPFDPKNYDTALISSVCQEHWPKFFEHARRERQKLVNVPNEDDKARIIAYGIWHDFYRNRPEFIKVACRDDTDEDDVVEIYAPGAKKLVEATNRFLLVDFDAVVQEDVGSAQDQMVAKEFLENLFGRERFQARLAQQKRYCMIKGDAFWHLVAEPWKREGERISLVELLPEHVFPIIDPGTDRIMGYHIVDVIDNPRNTSATRKVIPDELARRQTYRRVIGKDGHPNGQITSELALFEIGGWDDRTAATAEKLELVEVLVPQFVLPQQISQLPVYHIRNNPPQLSTFGVSEIAGIELMIKAVNQSLSDEDLTLITQGLGVYWTDAAPPVDAYGNEVPWDIGPSKVVQVGTDGHFGKVSGTSTVAPYQDHIKLVDEQMQQGAGVPDIAIGMVDSATAESGIALQLKLGPLLAKNAEKELEWLAVHDQLWYDLFNSWLPAYEGIELDVEVLSETGDPMPENRTQRITELQTLWDMGIMPVEKLYIALNELGYDFEDGDFEQAVADKTMAAGAQMGGAFDQPGDGTSFDESFNEGAADLEERMTEDEQGNFPEYDMPTPNQFGRNGTPVAAGRNGRGYG